MRRLLIALCVLAAATLAPAQNRRAYPRLEATSEFRPPTTARCADLTRQREGNICWDSDGDFLAVYDGSAWVSWDSSDWQVVVNDGDSTAGIQDAIDAIPTTGGTVYIPAGTYNVSTQIDLDNSVRLIGAGMHITTIRLADGTGDPGTAVIRVGADITKAEIAHLGIDGNQGDATNQAADNYQGIGCTGGNDDTYIHHVYVTSVRSGIWFFGSNGNNDSNRVRVLNNYVEDVGQYGIQLSRLTDSLIAHNTVIQTGDTGIGLVGESGSSPGGIQNYRNRLVNNYVNRSSAPTHLYSGISLSGSATIIGFLLQFRHAEATVIAHNTLWDNSGNIEGSGTAGQDGLGTQGIDVDHCTITGNVVGLTGAFGIDVGNNCTVTGNTIYRPGTHGIVVAFDGLLVDYETVIIDDNTIIDPDEANITPTKVQAISVLANAGDTGARIRKLVITNNTLYDSRSRVDRGISLGTDATNAIDNVVIIGNIMDEAATDLISWFGTNYGKITVRDNIAPAGDPYRGEATLVAGTVAVQNTSWPAISGLYCRISRTTINSSTGVGHLEALWDGTDTCDITSYTNAGATQTNDVSKVFWEFVGTVD